MGLAIQSWNSRLARSGLRIASVLVLLMSSSALGDITEVVPADRLVDWRVGQNVGVPGGIDQFLPGGTKQRIHLIDVTKAPFNADNSGLTDSSSVINNAISTSAENDVIFLPSGTYKLDAPITTTFGAHYMSNRTIRGAGYSTILKPSGIAIEIGGGDGYNAFLNPSIILPALARSQSEIPLSDTTSFKEGDIFHIAVRESSDPSNFWIHRSGPYANSRTFKTRVVGKSATSVSVFPPILFDMPLRLEPKGARIPYVANFIGVEDLQIDLSNSGGDHPVRMRQAFGSWFKGIKVVNALDYHMRIAYSIQSEIREVEIHKRRATGPGGSGIIFDENTNCLVEDNIITQTSSHIQINAGSSGNVFAYNFLFDPRLAGVWGAALKGNHAPHNSYNLYEGNISANFQDDGYHGSGSHGILFRNWLHGTMPKATDPTVMEAGRYILNLCRFSRNYSLIGNVLGLNGIIDGSYSLGWPNVGNSAWSGVAKPSAGIWWSDWPAWLNNQYTKGDSGFQELDLDVEATSIKRANYLVPDGVPSSEALNTATIPASLFRSAKPAYFGELRWPPISTENLTFVPNLQSMTTKPIIPAQARYFRLTVPLAGDIPQAPTKLEVVTR